MNDWEGSNPDEPIPFVVYVERANDVVRIISAREVEPYERVRYYEEG